MIDAKVYPLYEDSLPALLRTSSLSRDVGSISNLGARHFEGTSFLKKKEAFSKNKKGTSFFFAKSWGHVPILGARAPSAPWFLRL